MPYTFDRAVQEDKVAYKRRVVVNLTDGSRIIGEIVGWTEVELVMERLDHQLGGDRPLAFPYWVSIEAIRPLEG